MAQLKVNGNVVLDASNYTAYCTPGNIGAAATSHTHSQYLTNHQDISGKANTSGTYSGLSVGNSDKVDGYHLDKVPYVYSSDDISGSSGEWFIKISTPEWNNTPEIIKVKVSGNNRTGTAVIYSGSRQWNWYSQVTAYNGSGITGIYKSISSRDDVYVRINNGFTSARIQATFNPVITVGDYSGLSYTSVPDGDHGGFIANKIVVGPGGGSFSGQVAATSFKATSDLNLKENIVKLDELDLSPISAYKYNFKNDSTKESHIGLVAQEVQQVIPEAVSNIDGHLVLDYNAVLSVLLTTVKFQGDKISKLEGQINGLTCLLNHVSETQSRLLTD